MLELYDFSMMKQSVLRSRCAVHCIKTSSWSNLDAKHARRGVKPFSWSLEFRRNSWLSKAELMAQDSHRKGLEGRTRLTMRLAKHFNPAESIARFGKMKQGIGWMSGAT